MVPIVDSGDPRSTPEEGPGDGKEEPQEADSSWGCLTVPFVGPEIFRSELLGDLEVGGKGVGRFVHLDSESGLEDSSIPFPGIETRDSVSRWSFPGTGLGGCVYL